MRLFANKCALEALLGQLAWGAPNNVTIQLLRTTTMMVREGATDDGRMGPPL
jgi:hypothetical protein